MIEFLEFDVSQQHNTGICNDIVSVVPGHVEESFNPIFQTDRSIPFSYCGQEAATVITSTSSASVILSTLFLTTVLSTGFKARYSAQGE